MFFNNVLSFCGFFIKVLIDFNFKFKNLDKLFISDVIKLLLEINMEIIYLIVWLLFWILGNVNGFFKIVIRIIGCLIILFFRCGIVIGYGFNIYFGLLINCCFSSLVNDVGLFIILYWYR